LLIAAFVLERERSAPTERRPKDPSAFDQERFWSQLCNRCRFAFAVVGLAATHFGYHQVVEDHDPSARMRVQLAEPMLQPAIEVCGFFV
jgi:hypothetical protein